MNQRPSKRPKNENDYYKDNKEIKSENRWLLFFVSLIVIIILLVVFNLRNSWTFFLVFVGGLFKPLSLGSLLVLCLLGSNHFYK